MINNLQVIRPGYGVVEEGTTVQLQQGDTLRVEVLFTYRVNEDSRTRLVACLGDPKLAGCLRETEVLLPASPEYRENTAAIDLVTEKPGWVLHKEGKPPPGLYDLTVYVKDKPSVCDSIPACVQVVKAVGTMDTIMAIMPMMLMMMVMGMMMPMMQPTPKKPEEGEQEV